MLADMQTQLTASRLMLYAAARSRGKGSAFPDPMLAAQAKIFASEAAIRIVNDALQMFGARGYSRDLPLERMARDVRMFTIGGGTAQVLRTLVASRMLGWKLPQTRDGYVEEARAARRARAEQRPPMPPELMTSSTATLIGFAAILMWSLLSLLTVPSGTVPPFQLAAMTFAVGGRARRRDAGRSGPAPRGR